MYVFVSVSAQQHHYPAFIVYRLPAELRTSLSIDQYEFLHSYPDLIHCSTNVRSDSLRSLERILQRATDDTSLSNKIAARDIDCRTIIVRSSSETGNDSFSIDVSGCILYRNKVYVKSKHLISWLDQNVPYPISKYYDVLRTR